MGKTKIKQQQMQPCVKIVVVKALPGFSRFFVSMLQSHGHGSGASERELTIINYNYLINYYPGMEDGNPYSSARGKLRHSLASPSATTGKDHMKCKYFYGRWDPR